ncbi:MAG: 16S rRNA (guanine(527)-N(7))-methyltransferase RsmG [candidate division KSB1 bacterium]|nr:16S rRNA (guanine(527)-N(7))-methyltransferase RsmG [candidate division KSB1 bacterium]MDZ7274350.1 16S rRNA (guanine(527)-N(7))-methyltransferase RsmG [candidate division KSB1 bacterium]MDZ7284988.1 16S rRNA (guanine(527)-N(7))-methyltransferase RsmG [candidate division KSB1 bacterium]MDZ7297591.1 16S rRNA (guanine(527)-N(7))-methyltransferase RsmG [candidate division KSB1 bacterium]MDZ7348458.1 16S rRNA (guanine(527)-N(7))-methyltransferase RsmG [candidate division KSB1 bacterium]
MSLLSFLPAGFPLSASQLAQFEQYLRLLLEWNPRASLVSKSDENEARLSKRHVVESLGLLGTGLLHPKATVLDLGSGGGFPGIPIKIAQPDLEITLLDSRRMKFLFLQEAIRALELKNAIAVCARAESLGPEFHSRFDFVVVRAVASLVKLWQWSLPVLKAGGCLLAQKGGDLEAECKELLAVFPGLVLSQVKYPAEWEIEPSRFVVVIKKT